MNFFYMQFVKGEEDHFFMPVNIEAPLRNWLVYRITEINSTCSLYLHFQSRRIKDFLGKPDWYLHFGQLQLLGGEKNI